MFWSLREIKSISFLGTELILKLKQLETTKLVVCFRRHSCCKERGQVIGSPRRLGHWIGFAYHLFSTSHLNNSQWLTGHLNNAYCLTGHLNNAYCLTGHLNNAHCLTGHLNNAHCFTGHLNNAQCLAGHLNNAHCLAVLQVTWTMPTVLQLSLIHIWRCRRWP